MNSGGRTDRPSLETPLANRICAGVAVGFAVWTVCAHGTVAVGGSLHQLIGVFAVAAGAVAAASVWLARCLPAAPLPERFDAARPRPFRLLQIAALVVAVALAAHVATTPLAATRLWWIATAMLVVAAIAFLGFEAPTIAAPARGRRLEVALWLLALVCAVAAVCIHRPDLDDAFYVNVAVAAADFPDSVLLDRDTMLGVAELPLHMPAHRIHTYELWNGAVSYLTGIPAILVFHWISAAIFGALVALAHARLLRLLTPRLWPWAVAALVLVLLGVGETHRWFGNFALVRMWQGKAVYLYVFMPLVYAYAIEFALRPSPIRWILLCAAQTAAVGCSSSAVWAAPVGAWIAMSCVLRPTRNGLLRLLVGALSSAYVLAIGLGLKGEVQSLVAPMIETSAVGNEFGRALRHTLGSERLWQAGVAVVLAAWACCQRGLAQRFALAVVFAVFSILLNPYLDHFVRSNLTGPSYWRAMWAIPVPLLTALVLISPLQFEGPSLARRVVARGACAALCLAFFLAVPKFSALSAHNGGAGGVGIRIGTPGVKAPPEPYRLASALNDAVPPHAAVVAPPDVGVWITTFHDHAHPLQARRLYLERHRATLGDADVNLREFMTQYAGGETKLANPEPFFDLGLRRFDVKGVLLRNSALAAGAREVLARNGFERTLHAPEYEIWVRPVPEREEP